MPISACFRIFLKPFPGNLLEIWMSQLHGANLLLAFHRWLTHIRVYIGYTLSISYNITLANTSSETCIILFICFTIFIFAVEVFQLLELVSCLVHDKSVLGSVIVSGRLCVIALVLDVLEIKVESSPQEVFFIILFINLRCLLVKLFLIFRFYSSDNKGQSKIWSVFFLSLRICNWFSQSRFLHLLFCIRDLDSSAFHIGSLRLSDTTIRLLRRELSRSFGNNT